MTNCPEYSDVLFATWHAGAIAVPMNAKLHSREFAYMLNHSGAQICFVTENLEPAIREAGGIPPLIALVVAGAGSEAAEGAARALGGRAAHRRGTAQSA